MRFERGGSSEIVKEMVPRLGESRTIEILNVGQAKLKSLLEKHGCLTDKQLERISDETATSWPRWLVEGTAHYARTAQVRERVDSARKLWDEIDYNTTPWPLRSFRRSKKARAFGQAV